MGASPSSSTPRVFILPAEKEDESEVIRHYTAKYGLVAQYDESVKTLYDVFFHTCKKHPSRKFLGWRWAGNLPELAGLVGGPEGAVSNNPYQWMDYQTAFRRAIDFGAGLVNLGLVPHQDKVGLFSTNRPEWILSEQACNAYSLTLVPIYDTLEKTAYSFIINQTKLSVLICTVDKVSELIETSPSLPSLKTIIFFDTLPPLLRSRSSTGTIKQNSALRVFSFEEIEGWGNEIPNTVCPPLPTDVCTISYTSGTTGNPKGVLITHENLIADIAGCIKHGVRAQPSDVHISYLPLAHIFERLVVTSLISGGAAIGFYRGKMSYLFEDVAELKPTIFSSVPQLWTKFYEKVMTSISVSSKIKISVWENAYQTKLNNLRSGVLHHVLWDNLVFNTIRNKLGGNVRIVLVGSAPMPQYIMNFIRICFSVAVIEGYGQTETPAAATLTLPGDTSSGHVGIPLPCIEMKLKSVPEMGYFVTDHPEPRGEVCFRGPCVAKGYFGSDLEDEMWDMDGWYNTGDIGSLDEKKNLRIIDRKKNIFKLLNGPYVSPERLENIYLRSKLIHQCFVFGDARKPYCVAIVIPQPSLLNTQLDTELSDPSSELLDTDQSPSPSLSVQFSWHLSQLSPSPMTSSNLILPETPKETLTQTLQKNQPTFQTALQEGDSENDQMDYPNPQLPLYSPNSNSTTPQNCPLNFNSNPNPPPPLPPPPPPPHSSSTSNSNPNIPPISPSNSNSSPIPPILPSNSNSNPIPPIPPSNSNSNPTLPIPPHPYPYSIPLPPSSYSNPTPSPHSNSIPIPQLPPTTIKMNPMDSLNFNLNPKSFRTTLIRTKTKTKLSESLDYKLNHSQLKTKIFEDMKKIAKEEGLFPWEIVVQIWVSSIEMTVYNGLLTPTMKIRRNFAKLFYQQEIEHLYSLDCDLD